VDGVHTLEFAMEIVGLAPYVALVDPWKETPELRAAEAEQVRAFLDAHTPA
jgi:hypothetical protein